jgi:adenosylmethionine-8-amino-7-oxononanoate aminotransferase
MTERTDRDRTLELDRRHIWRPYTSGEEHQQQDPFVIARAEGAWLEDMNGTRYLDGNGSWWCNNLGHGNPRLRAALTSQAEAMMHCALAGITHPQAASLAEELADVAPAGLERVFYSDNGSTANEVAVKIALQYWQQNGSPARTRFLTLPKGYHGDTIGTMSVSGVEAFRSAFGPLMFETETAPEPADGEDWERTLDGIERTLREGGDTFAGVLVEPLVQGAGGMRMYPAEMLRRIRQATRDAGTLLIADEVFTGFGRTGPMWACEHAGVTPDLLSTAKGLSGGVLPFAATLATEELFEGFQGGKSRALMHGHTFCGNPLGAAVAREVLAVYRDEDVLGQVARGGRRIAEAMSRLAELPGVTRPRSLGMVAAADLGQEGYYGHRGWRVYEAARRRGAYLRPLGDTVYVCPPLTIPESDLGQLLDILHDSVAEVMAC